MRGMNLQKAELSGVQLQGADLRGANLQEAKMFGVQLKDADLRNAKLEGASLSMLTVHHSGGFGGRTETHVDLSNAQLAGTRRHQP